MARTIVHLIHGTWPYGPLGHVLRRMRRPESTWFHPDSQFCRALRAELPSDVTLCPFEWSGDNSYLARHAAAERLAARLGELDGDVDRPHQVLVAHSHGGNVAWLAAMHPGAPPLGGIATLGTPFLLVDRRINREREERVIVYVQRAALILAAIAATSGLDMWFRGLNALSRGNAVDPRGWAFIRANPMFVIVLVCVLWTVASAGARMDSLRTAVNSVRARSPPHISPWLILRISW